MMLFVSELIARFLAGALGRMPFNFILLTVFLAIPCSVSVASDASVEMTSRGARELEQGRDQAALELFEAAVAADPRDVQARLFAGTALNQLDRYDEALRQLNLVIGADASAYPEALFQAGRSLLWLGQYELAIERLNRFERLSPGRGQTSEFLGRAHLALGHNDEADRQFREALRRDASLRSTVLPYQAALAERRGNERSARRRIDELWRSEPDSWTARELNEELRGSRPVAIGERRNPDEPFQLSLSFGGGYSTDVRGIEVVAIEGAGRGRASVFDETSIAGSYTWRDLTPAGDELTLAAAVTLDNYPHATSGDFAAPSASIEYRRPVSASLLASLRLSEEYAALAWNGFLNRLAARAGMDWRAADRLTLSLGYTAASDDYLYPTVPVQDPDATSQTVSIDAFFDLTSAQTPSEKAVRARVGGFFTWNHADGADFDYRGGGIVLGLSAPVVEHVRVEFLYTLSLNKYLSRNSLTLDVNSIPAEPTTRRRDLVNAIGLRFIRPLPEVSRRLTLYVQYEYNGIDSNIHAYDFAQQNVSTGITWSY